MQTKPVALAARGRDYCALDVHALFGIAVAAMAPGGSRAAHHHRWREQDGRGHGPGDPTNLRGRGRVEILGGTFSKRKPNHYVFPSEHYGQGGIVYDMDPARPLTSWKEAWEAAKERAGVQCRFHDLRHTGCTRLLEAGVPYSVVAEIMGWSASTAVRMIREVYGHVGPAARRQAMDQFENFMTAREGAQKGAQSEV